jgi:DNA polymerase beta
LGASEKASGNGFKARAYYTAIRSLKQYPQKVKSGREAEKLDGVGKKIAAKIDEIISTGKLERLEEDKKDERLQALTLLNRVPGVGPIKARQLVDEHGFRTLEDLRAHPNKLTSHINTCLKYFEELEQRIPRSEMDQLNATIRDTAKRISALHKCQLELTTCGSYRRGATSSNDIDVLITEKTFTSKKYNIHVPIHLLITDRGHIIMALTLCGAGVINCQSI